MKKCPFCAESIQDEAIVCRYCGRDLEGSAATNQPAAQQRSRISKWLVGGLVLLALGGAAAVVALGGLEDPPPSVNSALRGICEQRE